MCLILLGYRYCICGQLIWRLNLSVIHLCRFSLPSAGLISCSFILFCIVSLNKVREEGKEQRLLGSWHLIQYTHVLSVKHLSLEQGKWVFWRLMCVRLHVNYALSVVSGRNTFCFSVKKAADVWSCWIRNIIDTIQGFDTWNPSKQHKISGTKCSSYLTANTALLR